MKKMASIITIYGLLEIVLVGLAIIITFLHIDQLPIFIIIFGPLVMLLGIFTVKSAYLAIRLNLLLSPLVVLIYTLALLIFLERIFLLFNPSSPLNSLHFYIIFAILLIIHIFIFSSAGREMRK